MNFCLRVFLIIVNFIYVIILPLLWLKSKRTLKQKISPISNNLLKLSATELACKIRKREVTSKQLCTLYINRIKEVNPIINAVVEERFEDALLEARNVDAYLQTCEESVQYLEKTKPLLGIPLTVKESCSLAGFSLCGGTLQRVGIKAEKDGDAVAKLKKAGAIPLLISNTPEISLSWETKNFITGRACNPYDVTRTTAGSSGGEGALLGSGASIIGVGSDVAGSIRLPAMFNGVFGHKPTARIISVKGHYPYSLDHKYLNYFVIGPMTRYAKDLKLMTKIMADETVLPKLKLEDKVDLSTIKVFYMESEGQSFVLPKVQTEILSAIQQSVDFLKTDCNCQIITDFKFEDLRNSCEIAGSTLYSIKDIPNLLKSENQNLAIELVKSILGISKYTFNLLLFYTYQFLFSTLVSNENYIGKNEILRRLFTEKLGQNGVFLYPTFTNSAFMHDTNLFYAGGFSYLMIFSSLGLPATHVPCGLDGNGMPIGIQVVAGPHQDRLCFAIAEALEKRFGGWKPPKQR